MSTEPKQTKDRVLDLVKEALSEAGVDGDIKSIRIDTTGRAHTCPDGTEAVWEETVHPDGTIVYQYVCR
ncbi:hypothetical protein [Paraburkholderia dipogonis]|uniref:hypothetical protein n=1 Tax=Paraburkholderia dipogonis TaxID=1211383 RepID=UPI0038B81F34